MDAMIAGRVQPTTLLGAAAAIGIANAVGVAFAPALLTLSPLLLIALSPLGRHLLLAATVTDMAPFVVVGTLRRMLVALLGYALGSAYGDRGIAWIQKRYPKLASLVALVDRVFAWSPTLILLVAPGPLVCALAGRAGMRLWLVIPLATAGHTGWMIFNYKLGKAFSEWLTPINEFVGANMLPLTLACIAIVVVYRLLRRRKQVNALHEMSGGGGEVAAPDGAKVSSSEPPRL
jgi:hypothetical protein